MKNRAINTANAICQSESVGIVMNRDVSMAELVAFAERLCVLFSRKTFHILNIRDAAQHDGEFSETEGERYTISEVNINDEHPLGRDPLVNGWFWLGNEAMWAKILRKKFRLSQASVDNNKFLQKLTSLERKLDSMQWTISELSARMEELIDSVHASLLPALLKEKRYYRLMSHISWGKKRQKYKNKLNRVIGMIQKYTL